MKLFGNQHNSVVEWIAKYWWVKGPPIALLEGFPGVGKSVVAEEAVTLLRSSQDVPVAYYDCLKAPPPSPRDIISAIADKLQAKGDYQLGALLTAGVDTNIAQEALLASKRLIIIDEAQQLLQADETLLTPEFELFFANVVRGLNHQGRLLLLSTRKFQPVRWLERAEVIELSPPRPAQAEELLSARLTARNNIAAVPRERRRDVAVWLGCNPRAINLLVHELDYDELDNVLGVASDAWVTGLNLHQGS